MHTKNKKKGAASVLELGDGSIGHRDGRANRSVSTTEHFSKPNISLPFFSGHFLFIACVCACSWSQKASSFFFGTEVSRATLSQVIRFVSL